MSLRNNFISFIPPLPSAPAQSALSASIGSSRAAFPDGKIGREEDGSHDCADDPREQNSDRAADCRKGHGFDQKLLEHVYLARTQGLAYTDFLGSFGN